MLPLRNSHYGVVGAKIDMTLCMPYSRILLALEMWSLGRTSFTPNTIVPPLLCHL